MGTRLPRLVVASFFQMNSPPTSGGEQRLLYLYSELSSRFEIEVVSMTFEDGVEEVIKHAERLVEFRIPKPPGNDAEIWRLVQAGIGDECSGYVVGLLGSPKTRFGTVLAERAAEADIVSHEFPYTLTSDAWPRGGAPRVYMSHNNEARLAPQMLKGLGGAHAASHIAVWERRLLKDCSAVFATCDEERHSLAEDYGVDASLIRLAPNGFRLEDVRRDSELVRNRSTAVFMGSRHPPNVEAVGEIIERLASMLPELDFLVIGSVCTAVKGNVPGNVKLLGLVSTEEKSRLLAGCTLAINPLLSGAGTNLKMLDYLGAGAPVLTTPVGARGLDLVDGQHARVVPIDGFAAALRDLLANDDARAALGTAGQALAMERYTWSVIADSVASKLMAVIDAPRPRRLLVLCDYSVARPTGGGQVRLHQLMKALGGRWDVELLCLHDGDAIESERLAANVVEHRIPKCASQRGQERDSMAGEWISIGDVIAGRWCASNTAFASEFAARIPGADIVMFEQPFLADLLDLVDPAIPVVYSSQNVEAALKASLLLPRKDREAVLREVEQWEKRLLERAALVICVSREDRAAFRRHQPSARYRVIENGVSMPVRPVRSMQSAFATPMAMFIGSAHPPNVEAARFIVKHIAPLVPGVGFAIVGHVCEALATLPRPANVLLLGRLDDDEKSALFDLADFAVNPMFSGGGSSLKLPDFWSHGLAVLSTATGVRGFHCTHLEEVFICETADDFIGMLESLCADLQAARAAGQRGRQLAEGHSWEILADRLDANLSRLVRAPRQKKSVLVVTYRFGHPLRGGAEVYLDAVLKNIITSDSFDISVAAIACSTIDNAYSFSAHYAPPALDDRLPEWIDPARVHLFPVDPPPEDLLDRCRRLSAAWMARSRRLVERLAPEIAAFELGGGWNYPEPGPARWMGLRAQIMLPQRGTFSVRVDGGDSSGLALFSPAGRRLERVASKPDLVAFRLESGDEGLCVLATDALQNAPGDPREMTCRVIALQFDDVNGGEVRVDLAGDVLARVAAAGKHDWVRLLLEETRNDSSLNGFADVRGPWSEAMLDWVERNADAYDAVLVQGVPFATSIDVVNRCRSGGVPVLVLPHAHIEDPFYHWPEIYRALADSDAVVASPDEVATHYLEPIGASPKVLPGGGVDPSEFDASATSAAVDAFRAVHSSRCPYILVLGRKAGAKRYDRVIDSHQRLVAAGVDIDLVLIGPDEDRLPVRGRKVYYLGAQPREVILGVLHEAICLVSMSESESFGIVILEAWMSGVPVIANRGCMAFRQLVAHGENGQLVASDAELDGAIRLYLESPLQRDAHAAAGKRHAAAYHWSNVAGRVVDLLESISR